MGMTKMEFIGLFKSAEESWGKYSDLKKSRIFHFCEKLSAEQFRKLIIHFVDNGTKPDVIHFRQQSGHLSRTEGFSFADMNECAECGDLGLIEFDQKDHDSFFAACVCERGQREKKERGLLSSTEVEGEEISRVPLSDMPRRWKPDQKVSKEAKINAWKVKLAASRVNE